MREQARLEVHAHDPGDQGAGKEDHGRERENLDDLVRPVPRPGDQDVERSVDALADVPRTFERLLVAVDEELEPPRGVLVAEGFELRMRECEQQRSV